MPDQIPGSLPIVSLKNLDPSQQHAVSVELHSALRQHGFLYVSDHGIPESCIANLRSQQRQFFALPFADKHLVAINQLNRGYLGEGEARMHGAVKHDQKEVFFWGNDLAPDHPQVKAGLALCGPNQWPDKPAGFRQTVLEYTRAAGALGNYLLGCVALSLDAPTDFFARFYRCAMTRGQLIHYPPTVGDKDDFGVAPHTDFGCITLLLQETPGLEVHVQQQWIPVPPVEGTLVINIGDLAERWSDARLPSTRHRVRNNTGDARYSIAVFHDPDPDAIVDPADLHCNDNGFTPVAAADYILQRNTGAFAHFGEVEKASPSE